MTPVAAIAVRACDRFGYAPAFGPALFCGFLTIAALAVNDRIEALLDAPVANLIRF